MFQREAYTVSRTDLPVADLTNSTSVFASGPEFDAAGHWFFGADRGFDDLISGQLLTQQGAAPTLGAGFATINGNPGNGLLTPFSDAAVQTMCMVVRMPSGSVSSMLAGAIAPSAGDGGSGLYFSSSSVIVSANTRHATTPPILTIERTGATGSFIFIALSENLASANGTRTLYMGGRSPVTDTPAGAKTVSNKKIAIGNGYYNGFTVNATVAEYMLFRSAKSVAELGAIYQRSQNRLAARGITIV